MLVKVVKYSLFQGVTSRRKIPENAEKMRVGLEHPPASPTPTTSIACAVWLSALPFFPTLPQVPANSTLQPTHTPITHTATATQPAHTPIARTATALQPTHTATAHAVQHMPAHASTCTHSPYTYNPHSYSYTAYPHAHSTHHHSYTATAQHHNTYKQYISSD